MAPTQVVKVVVQECVDLGRTTSCSGLQPGAKGMRSDERATRSIPVGLPAIYGDNEMFVGEHSLA